MGRDSMSSERDLESCLLSEDVLERVIQPDACGYLMKRSGLGWYKYWFSLKGSKLYFFDKKSGYRGLMIGSISLFNAKVVVSDPVKRPLEFDVFEKIGKTHSLKAFTELEMQYWLTVFASARKKIPPPRPIATMEPPGVETGINNIRTKQVPNHVRVDRVMMVVHGIGTKGDNLEKNAGSLLKTCNEVKNKMFPDLDFNLEVLVVHWRDELLRLKIHEDMMKIIPNFQGGNALREFVMNRVLDMLYYTRDRTRNFLWKEVVTQLNGHYSEFKKRHPEFNGKLCLFGHSLGGIIVYEIASRQVTDDPRLLKSEGLLLDFEVESIYALGSPLGGFLTLEFKLGTLCLKPQDLPYRIYNIFHPNDPVALRLEPVVDDRYTPVPPVVIPHWRTMDKTQNAVKWLGGFWKPKSSNNLPRETFEAENQEEAPHTPNCSPELPTANSSKNLDQYRRYDYTLQVTSAIEEVSTAYSAMKAHQDYWTSRDTALLLLSTMLRESVIGEVPTGLDDTRMSLLKFRRQISAGQDSEYSERSLRSFPLFEMSPKPKPKEETVEQAVKAILEEIVDSVVAKDGALSEEDEGSDSNDEELKTSDSRGWWRMLFNSSRRDVLASQDLS